MTHALPRTLFVSHEATRTGAPKCLLGMLRWARANTALDFEVILRRGGPLTTDFAAVAPMHLLDGRPASSWSARMERELGRGPLRDPLARTVSTVHRRRLHGLRDFELAYLNSAVAASVIGALPGSVKMLVSHIHELDTQLEHSLHREADRVALFDRTDRWIAAGEEVRLLLEDHGVDSRHIAVQPEFIEVPAAPDPAAVAQARRSLGIPPDARVVGTMGTIEPRKGPDLFVALAQQLRTTHGDDVHLLWVGAPTGSPWQWPMEEDIRRAGLSDVVHLAGAQADPMPYLAATDVFVLTSREDPFPLACLEAAALGRPVVSFASGGMSEFLAHGGGTVVPALHVAAMAAAVSELLDDASARARAGELGAAEVRRHHDVQRCAPQILAQLETWWRERPGAQTRADG